MATRRLAIWGAVALAATVVVSGQNQTPFRSTTDFVTTDVIVRKDGKSVPGLRQDEFRVYEDDVLQTITLFEPRVGGRSLGNLAATGTSSPAPVREGLILPTARRPATDSSGRLFMIFIDDLHLQPANTLVTRDVLRQVRDILVQDNDLVGFVSSGRSSIALDPAYDPDHRRFNEVIGRVVGSGATPDEIVQDATAEGVEGPPGLRYNVHVAFKTALELVDQMAAITDRRKVFIYVSNGYAFNPFSDARLQQVKDGYANAEYFTGNVDLDNEASVNDYKERESLRTGEYNKRTVFSHADLISELAQVERAAQRANVTFYPIDPRGMLIRSPQNQGKRLGLVQAVRQTQAEIIVSVDSDVRLEPNVLRKLVARFTSPRIAAVGGRIAVENAGKNWITMFQTVKYFVGYEFLKDLENAFGSVMCLSGCLTAYRRHVLLEVEPALLHRQLFGCAIKYGEDRFLTRQIVLRGYKTHLEKSALCYTRVPEKLGELISQQVRWRRSNLVDFVGVLPQLGRLHPVVAVHYLCIAAMLFVYPLFLINHLFGSTSHTAFLTHLAVLGFLGVYYSLRTRDLPARYRVSPASLLALSVFMPVTYLLLTPLAAFTLDSSSWETRNP